MSGNGKGAAPRRRTSEERVQYEKEYERIFRRTQPKKRKRAPRNKRT